MARPIGAAVPRTAQTPEQAFGQAVTELRIERKMTQEELAHALGYHLSYIGQIERGRKSPTLRTIADLARLFELPVSGLMLRMEQHRGRTGFGPLNAEGNQP